MFAPKGRHERATDRCLPGVFRDASEAAHRVHLTAKPVPLLRGLLEVVKPGGLVLDPFMGGGSTGVASLETGRQFIGGAVVRVLQDRVRQAGQPDGLTP